MEDRPCNLAGFVLKLGLMFLDVSYRSSLINLISFAVSVWPFQTNNPQYTHTHTHTRAKTHTHTHNIWPSVWWSPSPPEMVMVPIDVCVCVYNCV